MWRGTGNDAATKIVWLYSAMARASFCTISKRTLEFGEQNCDLNKFTLAANEHTHKQSEKFANRMLLAEQTSFKSFFGKIFTSSSLFFCCFLCERVCVSLIYASTNGFCATWNCINWIAIILLTTSFLSDLSLQIPSQQHPVGSHCEIDIEIGKCFINCNRNPYQKKEKIDIRLWNAFSMSFILSLSIRNCLYFIWMTSNELSRTHRFVSPRLLTAILSST